MSLPANNANAALARKLTPLLFPALVALLTFVTFAPSFQHEALAYDTPYLLEEKNISNGLSWEALRWAFSRESVGPLNLWTPLSLLSLQVEAQLWGSSASVHHRGNVIWHAATGGLLVFLLFQLTREQPESRSPLGATLLSLLVLSWSCHPARIESVAWIAQRKDVVCGFFCVLSLSFFCQGRSFGWLLLCWLAGLGALLAKPTAVALPLALFVLDWTRDSQKKPAWSTLGLAAARQTPLLVAAILLIILTLSFQSQQILASHQSSLLQRAMALPALFLWYFSTGLLPKGHTLFPEFHPSVLTPTLILIFLTLLLLRTFSLLKRQPLVLFGLAWSFLFFLPVSNLVPTGQYAVAVRYSYFIHLGLLFMVPPLLFLSTSCLQRKKHLLLGLSLLLLFFLTTTLFFATRSHLANWRDTKTLMRWEHKNNPSNAMAAVIFYTATRGEETSAAESHAMLSDAALNPRAQYLAHLHLALWNLDHEYTTGARNHLRQALAAPFIPDRRAHDLLHKLNSF
ncbi:hypothetical protein [Roseibacillus ishigakijimensis]|uniref:Glycosyltransferase RgtA/B/C/D-like domain-containing protein n=1 Tax=Roseibacillus ishigakijimensis TaxID=454146 RepID=A0A934VHY8_9BACT|nr:hypothetical protein [Roseibacillus ishigakijimensis]MBK1834498.1 hypothetical protein [Roseibacillus ishigakijimensis]